MLIVLGARGALGDVRSARSRADSRFEITLLRRDSSREIALQARIGVLRAALRLREAARLLEAQRLEPILLLGLLVEIELDALLKAHEVRALMIDLVAQIFHAVHERLVAHGEEVEILVAREQLAEAPRREQHLEGEERAALVDVDQPPPQRGLLHRDLVLRAHEIRCRGADLARDRVELRVERVHHARRDVRLAVERLDLLGKIVHGVLQARATALQLLALVLERLEPRLLILEPLLRALLIRVLLRPDDRSDGEQQREHEGDARAQTRRRCLPTDSALPSSPMIPPPITPSVAMPGSKKTV